MDSPQRKPLRSFLVYGGVLLLLAVIAMVARGFSRDVGDAKAAGRYSLMPLFQSHAPEELALTWNGLTLHFGRSMTPALRGFESAEGSTDIVFDGGARLRVTPGADTGGSVSLVPVGGSAAAGSVVVPFSLEGVIQDPPPAGAALAWRRAGRTFLFSLPFGGASDPEAGTLTLPLGGAAAVLQVQGVAAAAGSVSAPAAAAPARAPRETDMPGDDKLRAALSAWLDASWQGWSSSRYSAADASWKLADGTRGFSEDIGASLLSESVARAAWQTMLPLWSDALGRQQKRSPAPALTFVTSAFVGGVKDYMAVLEGAAGTKTAQARSALGRSDASVILVPGLLPLLLDHGSPDLVQKAGEFLAEQSPARLDLASSLGLAADLIDYTRLVRSDDAMLRLLKETVEKRILPAARVTDSGVFLDSGAGTSDVRSDVAGGALLLRAGTVLGSTLAPAIGRGLLVSSLSLADDAGFLPASLVIGGGRVTKREGALAPETIYPLVPLARFIPTETPLAAQVGTGAWVWTCARLASATGSSAGTTLAFSYPRGIPYNLVLKGLPPFTRLKLHGIPWHSDPVYYAYSDGWSYDAASRTLFMKITGRVDPEVIDIIY